MILELDDKSIKQNMKRLNDINQIAKNFKDSIYYYYNGYFIAENKVSGVSKIFDNSLLDTSRMYKIDGTELYKLFALKSITETIINQLDDGSIYIKRIKGSTGDTAEATIRTVNKIPRKDILDKFINLKYEHTLNINDIIHKSIEDKDFRIRLSSEIVEIICSKACFPYNKSYLYELQISERERHSYGTYFKANICTTIGKDLVVDSIYTFVAI